VILHAGAGSGPDASNPTSLREDAERKDEVREALHEFTLRVMLELRSGMSAVEAAAFGTTLLEDFPLFNAGTGSVLQSDGQVRMSASMMQGLLQTFSGVLNVERVQNPIKLAQFLQTQPDRVLAAGGAQELARELGVPMYNPATKRRIAQWVDSVYKDDDTRTGTVGVVVLDKAGGLVAATSTGGRGKERIGRVSDSGTPAGNFANGLVGISCTGVGEDILDEGLAVRIAVRMDDGLSLEQAFRKSFDEATRRSRSFGAIGLDANGKIAWGKTTARIWAAWHDGHDVSDSLDASTAPNVWCGSKL